MLKKKHLQLFTVALMLFTCVGLNAQLQFSSYGNTGSYQITKESNVGPSGGYDVYHPASLGANGELHPVITWGNGTGTTNESYDPFLRHLASYGFIVVASQSSSVGNGDALVNGVSWILDENARSSSKYYGKINPDKIGATGHSQGGAGTINAAIDDSRITSIAPLAPATFSYPSYISTAGLEGPIFIMIGSADMTVNPGMVYSNSYKTATSTAIYGELQGQTHTSITYDLGDFRKYVTAWFVATLWKDNSAEQLFFTENSPVYYDGSFSQIESMYLDQYDMGDDDGDDDGDDSGDVENIASGADVATSYVNSICSLDALNDGYEPTSSSDNSQSIYGNYDNNNVVWFFFYSNTDYEYVEYSWDSQQEISTTDIYWYNGYNTSSYSVPSDAYISYWNGSEWLEGPYVSTTANQWNTVSLNITTNKLRLYMYNRSSPTGVIEWKVNGTLNAGTKSAFSSIEEQRDYSSKLIYNYPNPFSAETMIKYNLSESNYTKLDVYDLMGKHIKSLVNDYQEPGNYRIVFNAQELPGGIYFYVLESGSDKQVGKMVLKN